jgi:hypothetical protein
MIQRASEIVNNVGDLQRPADDGRGLIDIDHRGIAGKLCVAFVDDSVRFHLMPRSDFIVEAIEQFFSAI